MALSHGENIIDAFAAFSKDELDPLLQQINANSKPFIVRNFIRCIYYAPINGLPQPPQCGHRWGIWLGIDHYHMVNNS